MWAIVKHSPRQMALVKSDFDEAYRVIRIVDYRLSINPISPATASDGRSIRRTCERPPDCRDVKRVPMEVKPGRPWACGPSSVFTFHGRVTHFSGSCHVRRIVGAGS